MKKTDEKGITLIALIITIIVMLILVGVTVNMAVQEGLFKKAGYAARETNKRIEEERKLASGSIIDQHLYGITEEVASLKAYSEDLLENNVLTENAKYISGNKVAVIPKGFAVSTVEGETEVDGGLVIKDSQGNQFVWVPVGDGTLDREGFGADISSYSETLPEELRNSISTYKGFYVGRYEAGTTTPRYFKYDPTPDCDVVVKANVFPYNYVAHFDSDYYGTSGAATLSNGMYPNSAENETGVVSHLMYGAEWDEMLKFVNDNEHDVTESIDWGNYKDSTFQFSGRYSTDRGENYSEVVTNTTKPSGADWILTTGASERNKAKNIYDIAGNVKEWTNEQGNYSTPVVRGSYFKDDFSGSCHASYRTDNAPISYYCENGFRIALYLR